MVNHHFIESLQLLIQIILLKVVDDADVVDVLTVLTFEGAAEFYTLYFLGGKLTDFQHELDLGVIFDFFLDNDVFACFEIVHFRLAYEFRDGSLS